MIFILEYIDLAGNEMTMLFHVIYVRFETILMGCRSFDEEALILHCTSWQIACPGDLVLWGLRFGEGLAAPAWWKFETANFWCRLGVKLAVQIVSCRFRGGLALRDLYVGLVGIWRCGSLYL